MSSSLVIVQQSEARALFTKIHEDSKHSVGPEVYGICACTFF